MALAFSLYGSISYSGCRQYCSTPQHTQTTSPYKGPEQVGVHPFTANATAAAYALPVLRYPWPEDTPPTNSLQVFICDWLLAIVKYGVPLEVPVMIEHAVLTYISDALRHMITATLV